MTTVYVDVAAVRIQRYLSRMPNLRGFRSASAALRMATDAESVKELLRGLPGVELNPEAGEADGVVHVRFPSGGDDATTVTWVQDRLISHFRRHLPAIELSSVWGRGETYVDAYAMEMKLQRDRGSARMDLPPVCELRVVATCEVCRTDPAVTIELGQQGKKGEQQKMCRDCAQRNQRKVDVPGRAEEWLFDEMTRELAKEARARVPAPLAAPARSGPVLARAPGALEELAPLDRSGGKNHHLATVYIDGNAFGAFFDALAERRDLSREKERISKDLNDATLGALKEATLKATNLREVGRLTTVPHLVGGDDVLVTLLARDAWGFTRTFLEWFEQLVEVALVDEAGGDLLANLNEGLDPKLVAPTASAAIVFAHASYPFHVVANAAAQLLREAKAHVRGRESSVQWLDVTTQDTVANHPPVRTKVLDAAAGDLSRLAAVPQAHRAALERAKFEDGADAAWNIALRVGRHRDAVEPFYSENAGDPPPSQIDLTSALDLVRWWPKP